MNLDKEKLLNWERERAKIKALKETYHAGFPSKVSFVIVVSKIEEAILL